MHWLDPPPDGTSVCGGFDGSSTDDWTAIRLETRGGFQFTPRYGPDRLPAIWNPRDYGGEVPRDQVDVAWEEINRTYPLRRVYCDPRDWWTEIEAWALTYGETVFVPWAMGGQQRIGAVHAALQRTVTDLKTGALTHDGCPITRIHVDNAKKVAKPGDRYLLAKPSQDNKIDAGVTSVLAHEAASDERAAGWPDEVDTTVFVFRR